METKILTGEFKGNAVFSIVSEEDAKYPIVSFGYKKAKAILNHIEDLKTWVEDQERKKK